MRLSLTILALLSPLLAAGLPTGTQAAISRQAINDVVSNCPVKVSGACADTVGGFLAQHPSGAERDIDIVRVVMALANAAKHPDITVPMCVELQQSILKLGAAVTQPAPQQQIAELAATLCLGDRTVTGSIGKGKGPANDGPPPSLIDQSSGGPPPKEGGGSPMQESGCISDSGESVSCGS